MFALPAVLAKTFWTSGCTYIEMLRRRHSAPAAKQRLAGKIGNTPKLWQLPSSYAPALP